VELSDGERSGQGRGWRMEDGEWRSDSILDPPSSILTSVAMPTPLR
jgi:hypothetical protein